MQITQGEIHKKSSETLDAATLSLGVGGNKAGQAMFCYHCDAVHLRAMGVT